ncbi:CoA-binding protein [Treponema parvum]|uniref:CoA-binding protein n=1 Tax=Treponema parvum TaxID=138851 RepID=A0A975F495_9SPIR|nr:CoA-binding protein [Treponema parvum]QTQ14435.1 CoA-binding protein [Treponema parvum]
MDLKTIMQQQNFVVLGNTVNPEKYAYKIKHGLLEKGYTAYGVSKEFSSINEISGDIDVIVFCINAVLGLKLIKECKKQFKYAVIQPGAESEDLLQYLKNSNIDFIEGCVLVGMSLYPKQ